MSPVEQVAIKKELRCSKYSCKTKWQAWIGFKYFKIGAAGCLLLHRLPSKDSWNPMHSRPCNWLCRHPCWLSIEIARHILGEQVVVYERAVEFGYWISSILSCTTVSDVHATSKAISPLSPLPEIELQQSKGYSLVHYNSSTLVVHVVGKKECSPGPDDLLSMKVGSGNSKSRDQWETDLRHWTHSLKNVHIFKKTFGTSSLHFKL